MPIEVERKLTPSTRGVMDELMESEGAAPRECLFNHLFPLLVNPSSPVQEGVGNACRRIVFLWKGDSDGQRLTGDVPGPPCQ
jgi:hypothetical protein